MLLLINCMIFLSLFFYDTSYIMSDSLALKFNISSLSAQRALALEDLGAIIGAVIAGPIGDNRGPRVVFSYSLICLLSACMLFLFCSNVIFMKIGMFICGIGVIGGLNGIFVFVDKFISEKKVPSVTKSMYISMFVVSALVPLITERALRVFPVQYVLTFLISTIICVFALVLIKTPSIEKKPIGLSYFKDFKKLFAKKDFKVILGVCVLMLASFYSFVIIMKNINLHSVDKFNLGYFQFGGRLVALASSLIITNILMKKSIFKVLKYTFIFSVCLFSFALYSRIFLPSSIFILIGVFLCNCLIAGYAQPIGKTALIKTATPLIGISQTLINLMVKGTSMFSNIIIFWVPNPYGTYLLLSIFILMLSLIVVNLKAINK